MIVVVVIHFTSILYSNVLYKEPNEQVTDKEHTK